MKLKSISAVNLAGSSFEQELADITLYHGPNFAGKSTRINALALALCHKLPGLAETPRDIFDSFATGNPLTVQCEADNGDFAGGCWDRDKKGKIETTFEGGLSAPALLFSMAEFLDLSAKERTRFLFSVLPPPPLDKVGPDAIVTMLKNVKCEPHTEAHEAAVNELADAVRKSYTDSGEGMAFTVQEWLEQLVEEIATTTKDAKAAAKTMRSTALGNVALRADAPALGPVEAAMRKAQQEHTNAVGAESKALSEFTTAERAHQEAKATAESYRMPAEDYVTPLKNERAELEAWLAKEDDGRPVASNTTQAAALGSAMAKWRDAKMAYEVARSAVADFDSLVCCPTCKAKAKGWKDAVLETLKATVNSTSKELDEAGDKKKLAEAAKKDADEAMQADANRIATIRTKRKRLTEVTASLQRMADDAQKAGPAATAAASLPTLAATAQEAAQRYKEAQTARAAAKGTLDAAETAHRGAVADAASGRSAQQATEKALVLEAKAEVGQALRDLLADLLAECVRLSIAPLIGLCNDLCGGILPAPIEFVDGEVVLRGKGPSHKTMSGSERAILYCALSVGLATTAPLRLVVLDELSRLDRANKVALLIRLAQLIEQGKIDQAILVDVEPARAYFKASPPNMLEVEVKGKS
jgi:hypothetical protein